LRDLGYISEQVEGWMKLLDENAPEVIVGRLLRRRRLTLAVAESCTGGLVSHRMTNVPGSSAYYQGAIVSYSNEVKERTLHVRLDTLERHGAVSEQAAREMAQGVRDVLRTDIGLSVTGIAGPDGGTPEKPVGLVYIALAAPDGVWAERHVWKNDHGDPLDRWENKALSADAVLDLLRRYLRGCLEGRL
jgi:nicotinamide-nucleotide amidase